MVRAARSSTRWSSSELTVKSLTRLWLLPRSCRSLRVDHTDTTSGGTTTYYTWPRGRIGVPEPFTDHH
jgi:hypothetical protein